jgi:4-amino-4-deoxy-L-arabinose transferase-like glycosyltransferase
MDGRLPQFGILTLIAGALFFARLSCPLLEPEEARYAEIPREMLAEGRFLEPTWHGEPYYHKPPLLYWLVMGCYRLFGVHDWSARLVPALASFASVLVTWGWGRRAFGPRAGFCGALILALSARFIYLGRMLTFDPLLSLWVLGALAFAHVAVHEWRHQWRWWLGSALLCGMGLLTKGPVALVLVLVPVLAFQLINRSVARPSLRCYATYLAVALGLAAPWYAALAWLNPAAAVDFFWLHNVQRYLDPVDHEEPAWFFLPSLLLGTLPWSLLLIPLGRRLLGRAGGAPASLGFCLLALGWCVIFFSLSGCKRVGYIVPALPLLALCLGFSLNEWLAKPRWLRPKFFAAMATTVFVVLFVGVQVWLPGYHRRFALRGQVRRHLMLENEAFCYPKRWDSVTFYLQRDDVRVFSADQRAALTAALQARPQTLMFVKTRFLAEFQAALPSSHQFVEIGRQGTTLTVGVVRKLV